MMRQLCPKTALAVTLGCALPSAKDAGLFSPGRKPTTEGLSKTRESGFEPMVLVLLEHFCNWYWYFRSTSAIGIGTFVAEAKMVLVRFWSSLFATMAAKQKVSD
jgi:hypothetical protein